MIHNKIAVFSDTHLRDLDRGVPYLKAIMASYAPDASMVLHAGDLGDPELLVAFEDYPVHRVLGNMDEDVVGVGWKKVVEFGMHRIGLIHGWGGQREIESQIRDSFSNQPLDAIVFGHTHWPVCRRAGGLLMFNPGSCVEPRAAKHHTFGILHLGEKISGEIINLDRLAADYSMC